MYSNPEAVREDEFQTKSSQYIPSADELRQRNSINIEFLSSGCVIRIGCKSIAFSSIEEAMDEVNNYVNNPIAAYEKWMKVLGL